MAQERIWRKSSYSTGGEASACVEVSLTRDVLVRDSKNVSGDVLTFSAPAWQSLLTYLGSR
ncbi:DUF397 domain-containing protein [Nocardia sp. NRRL S-836]|uniref:DUF397 domain-containing protein n=1 Tax=Nocardia sp. NRRL S-836 TaxID=1519492 RepID=UPI0006AFE807|nr:DUF397 domain-containing protein [Nocardia sp. NRRL S-836]KOV81392.1 hypothetical protein ADL03_28250 [Nocardia sp. NRRL S-836]